MCCASLVFASPYCFAFFIPVWSQAIHHVWVNEGSPSLLLQFSVSEFQFSLCLSLFCYAVAYIFQLLLCRSPYCGFHTLEVTPPPPQPTHRSLLVGPLIPCGVINHPSASDAKRCFTRLAITTRARDKTSWDDEAVAFQSSINDQISEFTV